MLESIMTDTSGSSQLLYSHHTLFCKVFSVGYWKYTTCISYLPHADKSGSKVHVKCLQTSSVKILEAKSLSCGKWEQKYTCKT